MVLGRLAAKGNSTPRASGHSALEIPTPGEQQTSRWAAVTPVRGTRPSKKILGVGAASKPFSKGVKSKDSLQSQVGARTQLHKSLSSRCFYIVFATVFARGGAAVFVMSSVRI